MPAPPIGIVSAGIGVVGPTLGVVGSAEGFIGSIDVGPGEVDVGEMLGPVALGPGLVPPGLGWLVDVVGSTVTCGLVVFSVSPSDEQAATRNGTHTQRPLREYCMLSVLVPHAPRFAEGQNCPPFQKVPLSA